MCAGVTDPCRDLWDEVWDRVALGSVVQLHRQCSQPVALSPFSEVTGIPSLPAVQGSPPKGFGDWDLAAGLAFPILFQAESSLP